MTWEHTWEPDLSGLAPNELRRLIYGFHPSPNGNKGVSMEAKQEQEFGLGDVVSHQWSDGYDNGTICQVHKDGTVDVFRPYVHAADFSCAGRHEGSLSILTYIGVETCKDIHPKHLKMVRKNKTPIR